MRDVGVVLAQVVIALLLTGLLAPVILAAIPSLAEHRAGIWAILASIAIVFLIVRLVWPRRKA